MTPARRSDEALHRIARRGFAAVVAAWGAFTHPLARARARWVLEGPLAGVPLWVIGELTAEGCPPHPFMLGYDRELRRWAPPKAVL